MAGPQNKAARKLKLCNFQTTRARKVGKTVNKGGNLNDRDVDVNTINGDDWRFVHARQTHFALRKTEKDKEK